MRYFITRKNTGLTREVDQVTAVRFINDIHPGLRVSKREMEEAMVRSLTHPTKNVNGDQLETLPGRGR